MAERDLWSQPFHWGDPTRVGMGFDEYAGTGGSGNGRTQGPTEPPDPWDVPHTFQEGPRAESGMAVGGWVPFANYLNTQANRDIHTITPASSAPDTPLEKSPITPLGPPGGGPHGGGGSPLVGGPGLGGYYGQLSQQYLTGKRQ